jgi:plasmid stabilization system protein ParE
MSAAYVVVSEAAEKDIDNIAMYIAADSVPSALQFEIEFNAALDRLRAFPGIGHAIARRPGLRTMRVSARFHHHLIVYRWDGLTIEVLRLLHDAMDIAARLAPPGQEQ